MSFFKEEYNGYKVGERVVKKLEYINHYGNSNTRYVEFKDEEGNILNWQTTDYTATYKSLRKTANYSFSVEYIFDNLNNPSISIKNLRLIK